MRLILLTAGALVEFPPPIEAAGEILRCFPVDLINKGIDIGQPRRIGELDYACSLLKKSPHRGLRSSTCDKLCKSCFDLAGDGHLRRRHT